MPSQKIETGHQDVVHDVARDYYYGDRMATASSETTIKIIGVGSSSHQHLAILSCHQGPVQFVRLHTMITSCNCDGEVIICKEGNKPDEWTQAHVFTEQNGSLPKSVTKLVPTPKLILHMLHDVATESKGLLPIC
ncbi:hypothetical protein BHE74_00004898 [Ensete ventricosum]|nr:hypothetical protein BHE74_00004898 [Ensete ventricosum]